MSKVTQIMTARATVPYKIIRDKLKDKQVCPSKWVPSQKNTVPDILQDPLCIVCSNIPDFHDAPLHLQ